MRDGADTAIGAHFKRVNLVAPAAAGERLDRAPLRAAQGANARLVICRYAGMAAKADTGRSGHDRGRNGGATMVEAGVQASQ
jgi:hypothetical protein